MARTGPKHDAEVVRENGIDKSQRFIRRVGILENLRVRQNPNGSGANQLGHPKAGAAGGYLIEPLAVGGMIW